MWVCVGVGVGGWRGGWVCGWVGVGVCVRACMRACPTLFLWVPSVRSTAALCDVSYKGIRLLHQPVLVGVW